MDFLKKYGLLFFAVSLVLLNWTSQTIAPNQLNFDVPHWFEVDFFETKNLYLYTHIITFVPIFFLSFDKKVAFYKRWKALFPALLVVASIFWVWDIAKTHSQVWGFNPKYYQFLIINLPVEEWLFFITFPFAIVFIYECVEAYFPSDSWRSLDATLSWILGGGIFLVGLLNWEKSYTATTWIPAGLFALWHFHAIPNTYRTRFYRSFTVGFFPFFLIDSIFTGMATREPLVVYNQAEYLGFRLGTIPIDDFAYNFLLEFMVITVYEFFKKRQTV